ncbi:hypothetical protein A2U01_0080007, partial [Trifolium medium]|nr:hypothetical protein [Trifolium medium]
MFSVLEDMVEQPIDGTTGGRLGILGIATVFHRGE